MNLFDFDFSQEVTQEDIENAVKELAAYSKKLGNPRVVSVEYRFNEFGEYEKTTIPIRLQQMIPHLIESGYVSSTPDGLVLKDEYKDFHTVSELIEHFRKICHYYLNNGGDAYGLYSIRTTFGLLYRLKTQEEQRKFNFCLEKELCEIQRSLGLQHFLNVPKSRGSKMNVLNEGKLRKIRRIMAEELVEYTDYRSVIDYFERHGVCRGLLNYNENATWIDHSKTMKLDVITMLPTEFKAQCIAESTDPKEIELILDYIGCMNRPKENQEIILINSKGERKRFMLNRDLKKTFDELLDLEDQPSKEDNLIQSLFSSFKESDLDLLLS